MSKTTLKVTDKHFRITIPEAVRIAEGIEHGDIVEMDVSKKRVEIRKGGEQTK